MAWGGVAMLTSAPFDNWWHNTYGLDVKILSPPHTVLALGILGVELGALVLALGRMNRAADADQQRSGRAAFLYVGAMIVVCTMVMLMEETLDIFMHRARFYWVVALAVPVTLAGLRRASGHPFAATIAAGVYTIWNLLFIWILPLFPAEPKLGPVYQPVTHFIPPFFPLLLIAPAFALDLYWSRQRRGDWGGALVAGVLFVGVLVAVQWPFARFLMSRASRTWFFGTHYFDYATPSFSYEFRRIFYRDRTPARLWGGLGLALACAVASTRLGLAWGDWMKRIRR
jgi:hypothetical protein